MNEGLRVREKRAFLSVRFVLSLSLSLSLSPMCSNSSESNSIGEKLIDFYLGAHPPLFLRNTKQNRTVQNETSRMGNIYGILGFIVAFAGILASTFVYSRGYWLFFAVALRPV